LSTAGRIGLWAAVAAYMAVIFVLSSQSSLPGLGFQWEDKLMHVVAFAGLGVLAQAAAHGGLRSPALGATVFAILLTAGYGMVDEFHQSTVGGRVASIGDVVADFVGALVGLAIFAWLVARRSSPARTSGRGAV
jgi:VanZ family protein